MKNLATKLKRHRCYLVVISLLLLTLSLYLYMQEFYLTKLHSELQIAQEKSLAEHELKQEAQKKLQSKELETLFESIESSVDLKVYKSLESEVDLAYTIAHKIYKKYKNKKSKEEIKECIREALVQFSIRDKARGVFINDYKGNTYLDTHENRENKEYRDIGLEMLNKVRRDKEGFIEYTDLKGEKNIVYVKELGFYNYFIGMTQNTQTQKEIEKAKLLELLQKIPLTIPKELL